MPNRLPDRRRAIRVAKDLTLLRRLALWRIRAMRGRCNELRRRCSRRLPHGHRRLAPGRT